MVGVGERHPTVGAVRPQGEGVIEIGHSATIGTFGGAPARYVAGRMPGAGPGRSVVDVMTQPRPTRTGCPPAPTRWLPFAAVGTVVTLFVLAVTAHLDAETGGRGLDALGVLLIVAGGVSIGLSPRWPRVAFAIDAAAIVGYVALGFPNGPFLVTVLITLGVMSRLTDRRTALIGAAALCAALALAELVRGGNNWFLPVVFIGWSAGAVFFGEVLRTRRTRFAELQERARTLERTRGGGGPAAGRRGPPADRARPPRRRRARDGDHQRAGRRRRPRHGPSTPRRRRTRWWRSSGRAATCSTS